MKTLQAAEYLLLSPKTLEKMRWFGNGPRYRKHAANVVYHIDDLKTWSASTQRNSTSE
ncbi:MAG: DNA-binding protein [Alphaproteobacteria bacterium]|nr:MAG: DNA-binding protein [Alphaproteobacteria bacterium]